MNFAQRSRLWWKNIKQIWCMVKVCDKTNGTSRNYGVSYVSQEETKSEKIMLPKSSDISIAGKFEGFV